MRRLLAIVISGACGLAVPALAQQIPLPFGSESDARKIAVSAVAARTSMSGLSAPLQTARQAMHDGLDVSEADLRQLAESGDSLAAQRLVRHLIDEGKRTSHASDIAYYSALAVQRGRIATLSDMVRAMGTLDPETEPRARIRAHIRALYPQAWAGNPDALAAVVAFNGKDQLFGELSDKTRDKILDQAKQRGDGLVELQMAVKLLERGDLDRAERGRVVGYLDAAIASGHLGVRTTAQNLRRLIEYEETADG